MPDENSQENPDTRRSLSHAKRREASNRSIARGEQNGVNLNQVLFAPNARTWWDHAAAQAACDGFAADVL